MDGAASDTNSWRGVHAELLRRIRNRDWPPGSLLPTEADLAAEFGCARTTVNRAMRELAGAGLLDRRRKAGTRVIEHPASRVVLEIPIIRHEVEQTGAAWRHALLDRRKTAPPPAVRNRMRLPGDAPMLCLRVLHFAGDRPFLLEDRWLNLAALPGAETVDFAVQSPNEWLVRHIPYTTGDIAFAAETAEGETAARLGAAPGAAVFTVDRVTWNAGQPITSVRLTYAPGYRMTSQL